ncbi:ribosome maturation factor RimP (plasmid) [Streptomyces sp. BHT-5-2]|uniref:ribosome maturation factor RimP n=1 Tax=Streptomyces sp. BHT-5-2 TaxID=2866715 RepID=UPI001C8D8EF8|nr:ribosome maturation factor RimP [Streptomyces sp. BHT-5-2]QZL08207.1 ribosome maturation factor RimP [Streptomyces sp. BHT-5-2]
MSTTQSERLRGLLEPLVAARDLDLEEIEVTPAGRSRVLRIVVDSDAGVQLDECAALSREASEVLDDTDAMGGAPYTLEVTSPGADRPLTEQRHYRRAVGRLIKARLHEGGDLVARIVAADDTGLDLEVPGVKGRKPTARRVAFDEIAKARVELEFNPRPTAPARDEAPQDAGRDAAGEHDANNENDENDENKEEA